jgi:hypothetical protein
MARLEAGIDDLRRWAAAFGLEIAERDGGIAATHGKATVLLRKLSAAAEVQVQGLSIELRRIELGPGGLEVEFVPGGPTGSSRRARSSG